MQFQIWSHGNFIIFNRGVTDASEVSEVCARVQAKVWSWINARSRSASFPFSSWCMIPLECMRMVV